MESAEKNKELVRRAVEEVWNGAQYHKALEFVSRDFVVHFGSTDDEIRGVDGISRFFGELRTAFPDIYFAIQDQVAEHDKVVTYYTASGTHTGVFKGIPPTGKKFRITAVDIDRLVNGRVVECWSNMDQLSLLQQLGVMS